jgi:transcriptional regulator with XRE-family HTH domain
VKTTLRQQFGKRVKELRLASGISQEAFADKCGYARSYMSRIERGLANPSLDAVEVLAVALKVEAKELFETTGAGLTSTKAKPAVILVPFADDGTCFNPTLRRPRVGTYTVGKKGKEVTFDTFNAALEYLKAMVTAHWRRPSKVGKWNSVVAVRWAALPKKYLMT